MEVRAALRELSGYVDHVAVPHRMCRPSHCYAGSCRHALRDAADPAQLIGRDAEVVSRLGESAGGEVRDLDPVDAVVGGSPKAPWLRCTIEGSSPNASTIAWIHRAHQLLTHLSVAGDEDGATDSGLIAYTW